MRQFYILDDDHRPLAVPDLFIWADWMKNHDTERIVQQDTIDHDPVIRVSTVFLGLDHNYWNDGPPVLWETMVFGGPMNGEMERYSSKADAVIGHQAMLTTVRLAVEMKETPP